MLSNLDLKSVPCSKMTATPKQPYTPGSSGCHKGRPPAYLLGGLLHPRPGDIDDQTPVFARAKNSRIRKPFWSLQKLVQNGTVESYLVPLAVWVRHSNFISLPSFKLHQPTWSCWRMWTKSAPISFWMEVNNRKVLPADGKNGRWEDRIVLKNNGKIQH